MNKLQGKLVAGLTVVAFFGLLGSAHAQGQYPYAAPAQPPMVQPQPPMIQAQPPVIEAQPPMVQAQPQWAPPPPMQAAPPMLPPPPMAAAAPNAPYDMTGSLGFGVGVGTLTNADPNNPAPATTSLISPGAEIFMRYWFNDSLSIMPSLQFKLFKMKGSDMQWGVAPATQVVYCPWKTASTRFLIGGGIGLSFSKWGNDLEAPVGPKPANTAVEIYVPISAGVEHFFAKWFSMGIAVGDHLVDYAKLGDAWAMSFSIDNTRSMGMVGFLFFYTD
jgi:hypothetical protein